MHVKLTRCQFQQLYPQICRCLILPDRPRSRSPIHRLHLICILEYATLPAHPALMFCCDYWIFRWCIPRRHKYLFRWHSLRCYKFRTNRVALGRDQTKPKCRQWQRIAPFLVYKCCKRSSASTDYHHCGGRTSHCQVILWCR